MHFTAPHMLQLASEFIALFFSYLFGLNPMYIFDLPKLLHNLILPYDVLVTTRNASYPLILTMSIKQR